MDAVVDFWRGTSRQPRLSLMVALVAALMNLAAWFGLGANEASVPIFAIHFAVMLLGVLLFFRIVYHHYLVVRHGDIDANASPPRWLVVTTLASFGYLVATAGLLLYTFGEGGPEPRDGGYVWVRGHTVVSAITAEDYARFQRGFLRVFSAAWLFFALAIAAGSHAVGRRIPVLRAARRRP